MLHENLIMKIEFEISEIETLIECYSEIIKLCENQTPDFIQISAIATFLHSFYNGLENIFANISKTTDKESSQNSNWHKTLLYKMSESTNNRNAVLTESTVLRLHEYLSFRHFFRHSYSYHLNWDKLKSLVINFFEVWDFTKKEIESFVDGLKTS